MPKEKELHPVALTFWRQGEGRAADLLAKTEQS